MILVVDDHPENRTVLRILLESQGYTVVEASDGREALDVFARVDVDLVVTDILMPNMDGYRLCHTIRSTERLRHLPVIVYSSTYTSHSDEKFSTDLGADAFIRKPAPPDQLVVTVQRVLAAASTRTPAAPPARPPEFELMQQYSQRLVDKLEEKNQDLQRQTRALQESEHRFRRVFDSANDAIFLVRFVSNDSPGRFVDVNAAACQLLGFSRDELLQRTTRDLDAPDEPVRFTDIAVRLRREKRVVFNRTLVAKDGRRIPTEISANIIRLHAEALGIAVVRDITERKQAERLRSAIGLSLSHELNTPLNGILGMTQLLELAGDRPDPADLREAVASIRSSAERLHTLIQRNLDFAQIELLAAGTRSSTDAKPATRDAGAVARRIGREVAARHAREADLRIDATPTPVALPERWLARLLTELLENAFKFSTSGSSVQLTVTPAAGQVRLAVEDHGRGMKPEDVAALGAFIQFDRAHFEQQGIGLGLYLARRLAELHGGRLDIDTNRPHGSAIRVTLPA